MEGVLAWEYWIVLVVIAASVIAGRALFYQARVSYLRKVHPLWWKTVTEQKCDRPFAFEDLPKLRRVLLEANVGLEKIRVPRAEPAGLSMVKKASYEPIDNLLARDSELAQISNQKIQEAIGAYRMKRNDTLNPVHWAIGLWTLPRGVAGSLGADRDSLAVKLTQFIYQVVIIVSLGWKGWQALH